MRHLAVAAEFLAVSGTVLAAITALAITPGKLAACFIVYILTSFLCAFFATSLVLLDPVSLAAAPVPLVAAPVPLAVAPVSLAVAPLTLAAATVPLAVAPVSLAAATVPLAVLPVGAFDAASSPLSLVVASKESSLVLFLCLLLTF